MSANTVTQREIIQDTQYAFPYHYLPRLDRGNYRHGMVLEWGYEYLSYVTLVADGVAAKQPSKIIDIGCGDGRVTAELAAAQPEATVLGVDYSERAIAVAKAMNPNCHFMTADIVVKPPAKDYYDAAVLVEVLEHIPIDQTQAFLSAASNLINAQGRIFVTVPSVNRKVNPKHYRHFTEESLRDALSGAFTVESIQWLNAVGFREKLAKWMLCNRLFILNNRTLCGWIYRSYIRHCLHAGPRDGARLLAVARRK